MERLFRAIGDHVEAGESLPDEYALRVLEVPASRLPELFVHTNRLRLARFGHRVHLCSIMNARSGACTEDCAFCAQSAHHRTEVEVYPLRRAGVIQEQYREAARRLPVRHFGVVTSGERLSDEELEEVAEALSVKEGVRWCASLGALSKAALLRLKEAGLTRFHHNLETAPSFFPRICSTHSFEERLATVRAAKAVGLEVCSGGIFGMGESPEERVAFARILYEERVDSVPLNFLIPVPGTRLGGMKAMEPVEILRCIAMVRLVHPAAELKVCAGRLLLGDLQSMIFYAGATGMMVGDLLTVAGREVEKDLRMLEALGCEVVREVGGERVGGMR